MAAPTVIDLASGEPDPLGMPLPELLQAAAHRLSDSDLSYFGYAPEHGSASLRERLAGFLSHHYAVPVLAANLLITAGASQALDLVLTRLCQPGDTVFVEDPTYFFALDIFADRGVRVVPVPTDAEGINVAALEARLATQRPRLLYVIPAFHNPTGATLPDARRRRLAELAREFGFLIVADEVYQLIGGEDYLSPPLATYDDTRVLSLGSFSKILGPGIRLGWIQGPADLLATLASSGVLRSGGGVAPVMSEIVARAIELGLQDSYLEKARAVYDARRIHMIGCLRQTLPESARFLAPAGGFYVWIELPVGFDAVTLAAHGAAAGVTFRPGPVFSCAGGFRNCLRLCFTFNTEHKLTLGVERLARLIIAHQPMSAEYSPGE